MFGPPRSIRSGLTESARLNTFPAVQPARIAGCVAFLMVAVTASPVRAGEAQDRELIRLHSRHRPVRLTLLGGWGYSGDPNLYSAAVGARAGYLLPAPLEPYVGLTFIYHFGYKNRTANFTTEGNISLFGAEFGKEFGVSLFEFTPYVGVGFVTADVRTCPDSGVNCRSDSDNASRYTAFIAPGLTIAVPVSEWVHVGIDGRYLFVDQDISSPDERISASGVAVYGLVGLRL